MSGYPSAATGRRSATSLPGGDRNSAEAILLPPAAQCFIQLHEGSQYIPLGLGELLFRGQPLALGVEYFQIAGDAADVSRVRQHALIA